MSAKKSNTKKWLLGAGILAGVALLLSSFSKKTTNTTTTSEYKAYPAETRGKTKRATTADKNGVITNLAANTLVDVAGVFPKEMKYATSMGKIAVADLFVLPKNNNEDIVATGGGNTTNLSSM